MVIIVIAVLSNRSHTYLRTIDGKILKGSFLTALRKTLTSYIMSSNFRKYLPQPATRLTTATDVISIGIQHESICKSAITNFTNYERSFKKNGHNF